jgi:hypothetical protein
LSPRGARVALVDEVERMVGKPIAVISSVWNRGDRYVDRDCLVTDKFGLPSSGRLPVSAILRVWRPGAALK